MKHIIIVWLIVAYTSLVYGYSTSGKNILGPDGKPILLRGLDRCSLEWSATGDHISIGDFKLMGTWGANVIRVPLSQCFWLANTQNYQGTISSVVSMIKSLKMGVILDLHVSDKGQDGVSCTQQTMADMRSVTFWNQVASAYKNDPWVIFELYNEPHDVSWNVWKNGGDAGGFQSPGFQTLYNTVRGTGANNLVLIGGLNWAYDLSGVPSNAISGSNIAYASHPYSNYGKMPQDWPAGFGNLANSYPVVLTEFGDLNCDPTYYNQIIQYSNQHDISWTAWAWYPGGCKFPAVIDDWNGTPNAQGNSIKNELQYGKKVPSGGGGGTITVHQNQGSNQYWLGIDSFDGASQTTQNVQFKDSSNGAQWVMGVVESWGGWAFDAHRVIVAPVSLLLSAANGESVTLWNVVTNGIGPQTYISGGQYPSPLSNNTLFS